MESYTDIKLKPCPFCGGRARLLPQPEGFSVDCLVCCAIKKVFTRFPESAADAWNRRVKEQNENADR